VKTTNRLTGNENIFLCSVFLLSLDSMFSRQTRTGTKKLIHTDPDQLSCRFKPSCFEDAKILLQENAFFSVASHKQTDQGENFNRQKTILEIAFSED
jgi:hypothetical protein